VRSFIEGLVALTPLIDQLTAGVQFIDDEMRYRYLNPAAAQHGRTSPESLIGRTMSECYPGIEQTKVYRLIRRVAETGQGDALENTFTFPDGTQGWFELRMYKVPGGVVVTSIDISARKNLELHVRHADRMEAAGKLAGGIAHDFNNLLMIMSSVAELGVADAVLGPEHQARFG
jgi:PAS domain S-box-containing protein